MEGPTYVGALSQAPTTKAAVSFFGSIFVGLWLILPAWRSKQGSVAPERCSIRCQGESEGHLKGHLEGEAGLSVL